MLYKNIASKLDLEEVDVNVPYIRWNHPCTSITWVSDFMNTLNKEEYRKKFDKWIERMQLCVDNYGDYFEHLMK